jgi:signal transduction histidine kinase
VVKNSIWLRGTLATGLTHELKSPLGILQSAVDVLREQAASGNFDPQKTQDYLDMAQKNLARLDTTVKGLLNVAKIQEQKVSIEKIDTDLVYIIRFILDVQKPIADKKGIALTYSGPETLKIVADPEKIEQALSNIVSNALKFSERGTIRAEVTQENNQVRFSLQDEGPGLNPKDLAKIFDRFYQAKPSLKGSGIGLTIAKAWIESHDGRIWAESEGEGKGTKVSFTLPLN